MNKLKSLITFAPKRIAIFVLAVFAAIILPLSTIAAQQVRLEATMGVANYTAGDTSYKPSVSATTDQVVKFQIWYHNMENADSGKVAKNMRVKINFPDRASKTQVVTSTVSADNANTINLSSTVNLDNDSSTLNFIPGSVAWRHNKGTNDKPNWVTEAIADSAVTGSEGINLGDEQPCFNFESTVTFMARVYTPSYKITKEVRIKGTQNWSKDVKAKAEDEVEWRMQFQNLGNTTLKDVIVIDQTPKNTTTVPGSVELFNTNLPNGHTFDNSAIQGSQVNINIANYAPGSNAWIYINSKIDPADKLACGVNTMTNHVYATPNGSGTVTDTATVTVDKDCDETPSYSCDLLSASLVKDKTYKFETKTSQQNAQVVDYTYDFGDGSDKVKTNKSTVTHSYAKPGNYNTTVKVGFTVNKEYKQVGGEACQAVVNVPEKPITPETPVTPEAPNTPSRLPETGIVGAISGTLGVSAISYGAYAFIESRKALRNIK